MDIANVVAACRTEIELAARCSKKNGAQWKRSGKNTAKVDSLPVLRAGRGGAWLRQLAAHFS